MEAQNHDVHLTEPTGTAESRAPTREEDAFLHRAVRASAKLVAPGKLAADVNGCAHHWARDDEHPTYHCCQKCGAVGRDA